MCKAAKVTIAEVEEIVETGDIQPDEVHVPAIYVQRVVLGAKYEKRIEVIECQIISNYPFNVIFPLKAFDVEEGSFGREIGDGIESRSFDARKNRAKSRPGVQRRHVR